MAATGLEVTLHQGRERAEVTRFTHTLDEIVRSLRDIDEVYVEHVTRATWVLASVQRRYSNLIVRLEARDVPSKRGISDMLVPVQALVDGAEVLQHEPTVPRLFKPKTVNRLAELSAPRDGVQTVSLATYNGERGKRVKLNESVQKNANAAVQPFEISYGSVSGKLFGLRERDNGVKLTIRDETRGDVISGWVPERLVEEVRSAWRHRVAVGGKIRRNERGQAITMNIDRIERMPEDDSGRPSTVDLLGAASAAFTSLSVDEFVKRLRDE